MPRDFIKNIQSLSHPYRKEVSRNFTVETKVIDPNKDKLTGISVSDFHVPYQREDLLQRIVETFSGADFCVVNGDLFDLSLISTFSKRREVPIIKEYNIAAEIVDYLAANFKQVILVDGNHDVGRFTKELQKLNPSIFFLTHQSPLKFIADGKRFDAAGEELDVLTPTNVIYAGDWWYKIGKLVFAHRLKGYRSGPMANAVWLTEHFIDRQVEFDCIISAHSHHIGSVHHKDKLVIDQGCLTWPGDYAINGSRKYDPMSLGCAYFEMDTAGNVDLGKTQYIYLGSYTQNDVKVSNSFSLKG